MPAVLKRFLFPLVFLVAVCQSDGQDYAFRHLTTSDGMLSDLRLVMTEDRLGRLWIGSDEGINVFDGYQLSSFSVPGNAGLLNSNIQRIYCDKQGCIWIYTPAGIQYKRENESRFRKLETGKDTITGAPNFGETQDGDLVIAALNGCFRVNRQLQVTRLAGLTASFEKYRGVLCFEQFRDNEWFVGFNRKLLLVDIEKGTLVRELPFQNTWCTSYISDSTVLAGSFVKDSIVILNTRTGAMEYINDWPTSDGKKVDGYAASICPVGKDKYAIGCRLYGVYIVDLANRRIQHLTHDPADPSTIKTNYVRRLFVTRSGTLFVHARAISYAPVQTRQISTVKSLVNEKGEVYDAGFYSFMQDRKNNIWVSSGGHLALWDRKTNISRYYPYYDVQTGSSQKFRTVRAVVSDALDRPWVGTFGGGLGLLRPDGSYEQFKRDTNNLAHSIPSNDIHSIAVDREQQFLLCCNYGFARFDPVAKKMQTFYDHPVLKPISRKHTYGIMPDQYNNWWIGQADGMYYYNQQKEKLTKIELPASLDDRQVNCFAMDSSGNVYAGGNNGLFLLPKNSLTIRRRLSKLDGLTSNTINSMVCDQQGKVWIVSNIGMSQYTPATGQLQLFDAIDGLEESNHPFGSAYMTRDGEIFVASSAGFNYFQPEKIVYGETPLKVFVTSLEMKDTVISSPELDHKTFTYDQNNFSFTYLVVDFRIAPTIQYRYKLEGFDTAYIYAGRQRTARYTNLPAGRYQFKVEASVNGKDWYGSSQTISFSIRKATWQTWWFRVMMIALVAGIAWVYYRNRLKQVSRQARLRSDYEIKLNELENSALRTQMNPHFIFNSLNTINSFINSNDRAQANQYISKFSKLVRLILDHSREKKISLENELEVAELYMQLEQIRFEGKFNYLITIKDLIPSDTEVPPLIIQPFVENAILHGLLPKDSEGQLLVTIRRDQALLRCTIEDNGIGREAAKKIRASSGYNRKSHGMEITLKRIELFNKEHGISETVVISDLAGPDGRGTGTRVEIPLAYVDSF